MNINVLIIWDGQRELDSFRLECIKQIKKIYPDTKLTCISKNEKILPDYIDSVIKWEDAEEELWNTWFVKSQESKVLSDYFRYLYLAREPYTLYIDTDIYIHTQIEETEYIAKWGGDYCAIWNGNCCDFFKSIVGMRKSNGNLSSISKFYPHDCGDLSKYMSHKNKASTFHRRKIQREASEAIKGSLPGLKVKEIKIQKKDDVVDQ